jgi:hypothetical protein
MDGGYEKQAGGPDLPLTFLVERSTVFEAWLFDAKFRHFREAALTDGHTG